MRSCYRIKEAFIINKFSYLLDKKMNIVIVVHYIFPHITGTDVGAFEQAKRYVRLGHKVTMISSNLHNSPSAEVKDGIRVLRVKALNFLERIGIPYPIF